MEIGVKQFGALFEQAHGDEEMGKKRTTQPRHGARIQHRERDQQIRAVDLRHGGPRHFLAAASDKGNRST